MFMFCLISSFSSDLFIIKLRRTGEKTDFYFFQLFILFLFLRRFALINFLKLCTKKRFEMDECAFNCVRLLVEFRFCALAYSDTKNMKKSYYIWSPLSETMVSHWIEIVFFSSVFLHFDVGLVGLWSLMMIFEFFVSRSFLFACWAWLSPIDLLLAIMHVQTMLHSSKKQKKQQQQQTQHITIHFRKKIRVFQRSTKHLTRTKKWLLIPDIYMCMPLCKTSLLCLSWSFTICTLQ